MTKTFKFPLVMGLGAVLAFGSVAPSYAFVAPDASLLKAAESGSGLTKVQFRGGRGLRGGGRGLAGRGFRSGRAFAGHGFRGGPYFMGHQAWNRGGWHGRHRYGWRGGYGGYGYGGAALGAGVLGLAAGAALAGAATPADDAVGYCESRFKSYNPATGTYRGYDGLDHPCP